MPTCNVLHCKNKSAKENYKSCGVTYHCFPSDPKVKTKWIDATANREDWYPTKCSTICSAHFEESCFQPTNKSRRLFPWAVPTLYIQQIFWPPSKYTATPASNHSSSETLADTTIENEELDVPTAFTAFKTKDVTSREKKLKLLIEKQKSVIKAQQLKIKRLQTAKWKLSKKISNLKDVLKELRDSNVKNADRYCANEEANIGEKDLISRYQAQTMEEGACRWCRQAFDFDSNGPPCDAHAYSETLRECFGVTMSRSCGLPLCADCARRLRDAWLLRRTAVQAESDAAFGGAGAGCAVKAERAASEGDADGRNPLEDESTRDGGSDGEVNGDFKEPQSEFTEEKMVPFCQLVSVSDQPAASVAPHPGPNIAKCPDEGESDGKKKRKLTVRTPKKPTNIVKMQIRRVTKIFAPATFKSITVKPRTYNLQPIRISMDPGTSNEPSAESNAAILIESSHVCPFTLKNNKYACFYCAAPFSDPDQLREHTRSEHAASNVRDILRCKQFVKIDVAIVNCRLCSEKIDDVASLKDHLMKRHEKIFCEEVGDGVVPFVLREGALKCALCDKKFPYLHTVNQHINEHFPNFVCETCGMGFVDQTRLNLHNLKHSREAVSSCEACGSKFGNAKALKRHVSRYHKGAAKFSCHSCQEKFLTQGQMSVHVSSVHGAEGTFRCTDCDQAFPVQSSLDHHKRTAHSNDSRYQCMQCGEKLSSKGSLDKHTMGHTGGQHRSCNIRKRVFDDKRFV